MLLSFMQPLAPQTISFFAFPIWKKQRKLHLHLLGHKETSTPFGAIVSDRQALDGETTEVQSLPKRLRRGYLSAVRMEDQNNYSRCPNYVEYEAQCYHIAEFLLLQQTGKIYRPAMPRICRWMDRVCQKRLLRQTVTRKVHPARDLRCSPK